MVANQSDSPKDWESIWNSAELNKVGVRSGVLGMGIGIFIAWALGLVSRWDGPSLLFFLCGVGMGGLAGVVLGICIWAIIMRKREVAPYGCPVLFMGIMMVIIVVLGYSPRSSVGTTALLISAVLGESIGLSIARGAKK